MTTRKAGRRSNSEGSLTQRKGGLWEARITLPGGRRRSFYAKTKAEALKRIQTAQRQVAEGRPLGPERLTVQGWLEQWLQDTVATTTRPSTAKRYGEICRVHIIPSMGRLRLGQLAPQHVETMLRKGLEAGQSPRSVHHWRAVLRTALAAAERHDLIGRNTASLAVPPRVPEREYFGMTPELAKSILGAIRGDHFEALYTTLLGTGLRVGEAVGLRWSDIDFDDETIAVRRTLLRLRGKFTLSETKTARSRRTVPMVRPVRDALIEHREVQNLERMMLGAEWQGEAWGGLVFTNLKGAPLCAIHALKCFRRSLQRAGLPPVRLHDLRHGAASLLAALGVPPRDVMDILGHANIQTTLGLYTHSTTELRREAMERLGRRLWPSAE